MHTLSPLDSCSRIGKEKLSYAYYIFRYAETKLCLLKLISPFHHLPHVGPKQLCVSAPLGCTCKRGYSYYTQNFTFNSINNMGKNIAV